MTTSSNINVLRLYLVDFAQTICFNFSVEGVPTEKGQYSFLVCDREGIAHQTSEHRNTNETISHKPAVADE